MNICINTLHKGDGGDDDDDDNNNNNNNSVCLYHDKYLWDCVLNMILMLDLGLLCDVV
jgi:hypothetical protein